MLKFYFASIISVCSTHEKREGSGSVLLLMDPDPDPNTGIFTSTGLPLHFWTTPVRCILGSRVLWLIDEPGLRLKQAFLSSCLQSQSPQSCLLWGNRTEHFSWICEFVISWKQAKACLGFFHGPHLLLILKKHSSFETIHKIYLGYFPHESLNLFWCDLYFTDMFNCVLFYLEVLFINITLILH